MNLITLLLKSSPQLVIIALITSLVSGACNAGLIAVINRSLTGTASLAAFVVWVTIALISRLISELLLIRLSQQVVYQMRLRLSQQILATPLSHLESLGNSQLLATLIEDVQTVSNAVAYLPSGIIAIAIVIGCLFYLFQLSNTAFLGFFGFLAIAMISYQAVTHRAKRSLSRARSEQDRLFFHLRSLTEGIKELKQNQRREQAFLSESLQPSIASFRQHNTAGMTAFSIGLSWIQLLLFTVIGLTVFALPRMLALPTSVISGYVLTMIFLIIPLDALTTILPLLGKADIALRKIERMQLSLAQQSGQTTEQHSPGPGSLSNWATLSFQSVQYTHAAEAAPGFSLGPITLMIRRGQLLFLTGGNGSGKSTFAKLLTGLYQPELGVIALDNAPITTDNIAAYRQQFSAVFYDFHLFDRLLGYADAPAATQYLKQLDLDKKVTLEQGKFSTLALSQGQRRRLALLVAYLEDRPFYVFDEWAADQDPAFRERFYTQLLPALKQQGKTIVVVTHDDRYFHLADRVLKLEYGKLRSVEKQPL